jgi:hypothetical protein
MSETRMAPIRIRRIVFFMLLTLFHIKEIRSSWLMVRISGGSGTGETPFQLSTNSSKLLQSRAAEPLSGYGVDIARRELGEPWGVRLAIEDWGKQKHGKVKFTSSEVPKTII